MQASDIASISAILDCIYFSWFRIQLVAIEEVIMPDFQGSTIRGALGHAIRTQNCTFKNKEACQDVGDCKCLYAKIMDTVMPEGHPLSGKFSSPPQPYIIRPADHHRKYYGKGEVLAFDIILIGTAATWSVKVLEAIAEMAERGLGRGKGKLKLKEIYRMASPESAELIYDTHRGYRDMPAYLCDWKDTTPELSAGTINLCWESPLVIKSDGRLIDFPLFDQLLNRLSERLYLLAAIYCGAEWEEIPNWPPGKSGISFGDQDFIKIKHKRYSNRSSSKIPVRGRMGSLSYTGDFKPYAQLLYLGSILHVGKDTVRGCGYYTLTSATNLDQKLTKMAGV